jgi:hypothetical protein
MGADRAATMMSLLPPVGWADIATKHDLAELESRLTVRIDTLIEAIDSRFAVIDSRFDVFDGRFEVLEHRFDSKLDRLRSDLQRTFVTWLFLSQVTVIAAVRVLLALLR